MSICKLHQNKFIKVNDRPIERIWQLTQTTESKVSITTHSLQNRSSTRMDTQVMNQIVFNLPIKLMNIGTWPISSNVWLADHQFNHPRSMDILLGYEHFYIMVSFGQNKATIPGEDEEMHHAQHKVGTVAGKNMTRCYIKNEARNRRVTLMHKQIYTRQTQSLFKIHCPHNQ